MFDSINFNNINDNCDNKTIKKHDDILICFDDSILLILDLNYAHFNIEKLDYTKIKVLTRMHLCVLHGNMLLHQAWTIMLWNLNENIVSDEAFIKI
jgi:hypothetical protein